MIKKIIGFLCSVIFCIVLAIGMPQMAKAAEVTINETNFPDANFRNYIGSEFDKDNNNRLSDVEITNVKEISVDSKNIVSLKGIEYFTALTSLHCYENQLTSLDVSKNTELINLYCGSNQLTTLDINKNTALTYLFCDFNQLTTLDVSKNTELINLDCYSNQLTILDVSKNTALTSLDCCSNQLTTLDVSKNTALTYLFCDFNQLTTLDVSKNIALKYLLCYSNQLTILDVSKNTVLESLHCGSNQLTTLDVSKNTALTSLFCDGNQLTKLKLNSQTYDRLLLYKKYLHGGNTNLSDLQNITEIATNSSDTISLLKVIDITKPATYKVNGKDFTIIYVGSTIDNPIIDALPDLNNLGEAEIKGPEISIGNNKFNLFSVKCDLSLPIFNSEYLKIKINESEHTAEVLIGLKDEIKTDLENDPYWKETYQQVKSLVKACGGKVDTPKLWNKFSKLRGKLKKLDGNAVFKVSGNSAGYIKLKLDENNNPIRLIEGGVVANLEANAKVKTPLWWFVYSEFGVKGSVDGKLCLTTENTKAIQLKGEIGLAINPSIAIGADTVVVVIKGVLEGEIGGKVSFQWKSFEECVNAWLSGRLFIEIDTAIPNLEGNYEYEFPTLELYPELGKIEQNNLNLKYKSRSMPTKRQYNEIKNYASDSVDTLKQSIVYENAKPNMIELPDGKILMVYLDDTVVGASGQAKLVYRLYKDGNWSEQKTVNNNMNLDTAGTLCVYNGVAYVVYENSNCTIDENMQSEDILNFLDLYVAAFDASSDVFQTPIKLGEISGKEPTWKYGYDFVKGEKSFSIIWAENSAGDILLENGDTEFYKSEYINGVWQEKEKFQSQKGAVQEFCFLESSENSGLFYVKDGVLYKDGIVFKTTDDKIDSVKVFNNNLYFRDNGQLCQLNDTEINMLNVSCTTNYSVLNNIVYWTEQNNFTSEIHEKDLSSEKNPVAITDDGGYIGSFCVINHNNGKPFLAYTLQAVDETVTHGSPYGLTLLKSKGDFSRTQAEILNLAYDILSYMPNKNNDIAVTVSNTGTVDLTNVEVVIYDTQGNIIHKEKISDKINSGEVLEKNLSVLIPDDMIQKEITVSILSEQKFDDSSKAEKKLELETNTADICLEKKDSDTIIIKNNGDTAENVTINIMDKNESGNVLFSDNIGTLKSGETKDILITEAWNDASLDENLKEKYLYCEVSQDAMEYALWDNSLQLQKDYSSTEPSAAPSSVPTQTPSPIPSTSPVVPSNAHIFSDYNYNNPVLNNEIIIYGNGISKTIDGKRVNNKVFTVYTDILASYKHTPNSNDTVKSSVGKVIVAVTKTSEKPEVNSKNKITDTSASNIAKARIKNGQITVTAVGKESGTIYLWVIDTGNKGVSACCPIDVKLAPKKLEIQDTTGSKLKNTKLANGNTLEVCVAGLVGSTKTDDCTYTATINSKYQSYITITPVDGSTNKFTIKATGLKNNKDTKAAVTFTCDQNGKKTNFSLTITK